MGRLRRVFLTVLANQDALPFSDSFARADGALGNGWIAPTWGIVSGKACNTPTLGAELLTNGSMETGSPPTGWGELSNTVLSSAADERTGGAGSKSLDIAGNGVAQFPQALQFFTLALGSWFQISIWQRKVTNVETYWVVNDSTQDAYETSHGNTSTSWANVIATGRITGATPNLNLVSNQGAAGWSDSGRVDDASIKALTLSTLFATLPPTVANVTTQVVVTVNPAGTQAGHVLNLDSVTSPANFVVGYIDGTNAKLDKCVAGTYTNVISAAVTFGAAKILKVIKNGNTYQLFYDGAQVGTDQTIASMNGTIQGLFSTHSTPKFDSYQLSRT